MYKSGRENRGFFCSLVHFSFPVCGLKYLALISSYDPNRLTAGGVQMTFVKHMPYAQSSEKYHTLQQKKSHQSSEMFLFSLCAMKKGGRFFMNLFCLFNNPCLILSYLSLSKWSLVDPRICVCAYIHMLCDLMCVYFCTSSIKYLFLVFAILHNNESCRDLMTAVVDVMLFP